MMAHADVHFEFGGIRYPGIPVQAGCDENSEDMRGPILCTPLFVWCRSSAVQSSDLYSQ